MSVGSIAGVSFFNVREYGARGDGNQLDTEAIQQAIDACAQNRGGTVVVPAGSYLIGTLFLRDRVTLELAVDAFLLGSKELNDYSTETKGGFLYNSDVPLWDRCMLYGENVRDVTICGAGTIDGQGSHFPRYRETGDGQTELERPMMFRLLESRNITVKDVTLKNSGCWCLHMKGCSDIRVDGITIRNRANATNDGIDLEDCRNARISNCDIVTFDDAIALKDGAVDVVITNCIVQSYCAAFRLGPESTRKFENIAVSNCVVRDTFHCGIKLQIAEGGSLENVVFSNIAMDNVTGPISVRLARWQEDWMPADFREKRKKIGTLRNVLIENIRARVADRFDPIHSEEENKALHDLENSYLWAFRKYGPRISCISVTGLPEHPVEGLTLSNIHVTFPGGGTAEDAAQRAVPDLMDAYPEYWMFGVLPAYGLYAHHARGLTLNNVRFDLAGTDQRPAVVCDDVEDLEISGFKAEGSPGIESLIRLQQTRETFIHGSRALSDTETFLRVEGAGSRDIVLVGNNLRRADKPVEFAEGASGAALTSLDPAAKAGV